MLEIKSLKYSFGPKVVFENLNLSFQKNKIYGIVGANGVGKTTLFRVLAKLYTQKEGEIRWNKKPLLNNEIGFLPTDPFFYPYMNGMEYLKIVTKSTEQLERAIELADSLNLPLSQIVDTYSTGMKNKLAFIACHSQERTINIYDEPFNGVDLESNEKLSILLKRKNKDHITILSSHILTMLDEICDEIIHIEKGYKITVYLPDQYEDLKTHIQSSFQL